MSTPKPTLPLILTQAKDIATHIGSFLDAKDLSSTFRTSKKSQLLFSQALIEKKEKKMAAELLQHVFNADPKKVKELLAQIPPNLKCIVLIKASAEEGYHSEKLGRWVCTRTWSKVSPLEAAALTGDNFLVMELLTDVQNRVRHQTAAIQNRLRHQAAEQLKAILKRLETTENGGYLAPFKALVKAYQEYIEQYPALYAAESLKELDALWGFVGEMHKRLSTYGVQEFYDDKPFNPLPDFKKAPKRSCLLYTGGALDLDSIGSHSSIALYKGCRAVVPADGVGGAARVAQLDSEAIARLCEVRTSELGDIIKLLQEPIAAAEDASMEPHESPSHSSKKASGHSLSSPRFF